MTPGIFRIITNTLLFTGVQTCERTQSRATDERVMPESRKREREREEADAIAC